MAINNIEIISIEGDVFIRLEDGSLKELTEDQVLEANSVIEASNNGTATFLVDGVVISLEAGNVLDFAKSDFIDAEDAITAETDNVAFEDNLDNLLTELDSVGVTDPSNTFAQALESGGDLLDILEATATGLTGGDSADGGNSFVRVSRISEELNSQNFTFEQNTNPTQARQPNNENSTSTREFVEATSSQNENNEAPRIDLTPLGDLNSAQFDVSGSTDQPENTEVTVVITDSEGNTTTLTTSVDADGNFAIPVNEDIAEGDFTVNVTTTDANGNSTTESASGTVDDTPPTVTVDSVEQADDSSLFVVSGTSDLPEGSIINITIIDSNNIEQIFNVTVLANGSFSATIPNSLAEGEFTITTTATDAAGNTTSSSETANTNDTASTITFNTTDNSSNDNSDNTPTISGNTELAEGTIITFTVVDATGDTQTFTTTAQSDGSFSVDVPNELAEGDYTVTAQVTDSEGNTSSTSYTDTVEPTPSSTLTLNTLAVDNDATPTINGNTDLPAGSTVNLTVIDANGDSQTFSATVQTDGSFSADVPNDIAEGDYTVTAEAEDAAGNLATASESGTLDTTAPTLTLDAQDIGNDTTPTISGNTDLPAGSSVSLTVVDVNGDSQTFTATVQSDGSFTADVPNDIAEGEYTVTAEVTDNAGNTNTASQNGEIDTTAPTLTLDDPGVGNDATPTITGNTDLPTGATVNLTVTDANNDTQTFTTTVQADGSFSTDVPSDIAEGNYTVTANVTDDAENTSSANQSGELNSSVPVLTLNPLVTGNDATPTISGNTDLPAGDTINISLTDSNGDVQTFAATVQGDGSFSVDVPNDLAEGGYTVTAQATDIDGNTASTSYTATADFTAPTISLDTLNPGSDTTPTISGNTDLPVGSTVNLTVIDANGNSQTFSTTVQTDGSFSADVPNDIAEGDYTVTAEAEDAAGNLATASESGTLDTVAPTLTLDAQDIGNDTTPTISGNTDLPAGSSVSLTVVDVNGDSQTFSATVQTDGSFSADVPNDIAEGDYTVTAEAEDAAGNSATASESGTLDTTAPTLTLNAQGTDNDTTPTISGNTDLPAGSTVNLTVADANNNSQTFTATVQSDGSFSADVPNDLTEGTYTVNAEATDIAGNSATASESGTLDTTAPTLTLDAQDTGNDATPTITGNTDLPAGSTVNLTVIDANSDSQTFTATIQTGGSFSADVPNDIAEGDYTVTAEAEDAAGNSATASETGTLDTTAPTLTLDTQGISNDATPTITGETNLPSGSTVTIIVTDSNGDSQTFTTTAQLDGSFSVDVPNDIAEGEYTVTAEVTDNAGNTNTASQNGEIDITAPTLTLNDPGVGNDATPTITGNTDLPTGATVNLTVIDANNDTQTFTATVQADGSFSADVPNNIAQGNYTVTANVTDDAENTSSANQSGELDSSVPVLTLNPLGTGNDATPTISGNTDLAAGDTVNISLTDSNGDVQTFTATVQNDGSFSIDVPNDIPEGDYTILVEATDGSSNTATTSYTGNIDTTAPTLTLDIPSIDNNTTPQINGNTDLPAGSSVNFIITDADGNAQTITATVQADGSFSVDIPNDIAEGNYTVTAQATDTDGNTASTSYTATADFTAPTISLDTLNPGNDTTPTISGDTNQPAGSTVNLSVNDSNGNTQTFTATVQSDGSFSTDIPNDIAEGEYTVTAEVTDTAGNTNTASQNGELDTTPPILILDEPGTSNDSTPTISGNTDLPPGSSVDITVVDSGSASQTFTATVQADGTFSADVPNDIAEGNYTVSAEATDSVGNTSNESHTGVLDTTAPTLTLDASGATNDTTPVITGNTDLAEGSTVNITVVDINNITQIITATVQANGSFSAVIPNDVAEGNYTVTAEITDTGHTATTSYTGTVDTTAPIITLDVLGEGNDSTPTISGQTDLPFDSSVNITITDNGSVVQNFTTTVELDGSFSIDTPNDIAEGDYTVAVNVTDVAGNSTSTSQTATLDTETPILTISPIAILNEATPTISGTSNEIGALVTIILTDDSSNTLQTFTTTVLSDGSYSADILTDVPEGLLNVEVSVLDAAGNVATANTSGLIDLTIPVLAIPVLSALNDANPTISGTTDEAVGSIINVSLTEGDGSTQTFTTTVLDGGTYSVDIPDAISEGLLDVEVSVIDAAGNIATANVSGLIDLSVPTLTVNAFTLNEATPTISGTSNEIGALVTIILTDDNSNTLQTFTTTVLSDGSYSADIPTDVPEGLLNVEVSVLDAAGNVATANTSGLIDLTIPVLAIPVLSALNDANPTISGTTDEAVGSIINVSLTEGDGSTQTFTTTVLDGGTYSVDIPDAISEGLLDVEVSVIDAAGNLATANTSGLIDLSVPTLTVNAFTLNEATPTISGESNEIGGLVTIILTDDNSNTLQTFTTTVLSNGSYSADIPADVPEGLLNVEVSVLDAAGNVATANTSGLIDLTIPVLAIPVLSGLNNSTPTITGSTDEAVGSIISITVTDSDTNSQTFTTTVLSDNTYTVDVPSAVSEGLLNVEVSVIDAAGNLATANVSGLIDLSVPTLTVNAFTLNEATPTISGISNEIGTLVTIILTDDNSNTLQTFTTTVLSNGSYSADIPADVPEGLLNVEVSVLDAAGNVATANTSGLIDLTIPVLAIPVLSGLNNSTPTITGSTDEAVGSIISITVTDSDTNSQTFTTTVLSDNTYTVDVPSAVSEGLLNVEVSVIDAAGNVATVDVSGLIDLTVPLLNLDALTTLNDLTPTIAGDSSELNTTINIETTDLLGNIQTFTTTTDGNGDFSVDIPTDVAEGLLDIAVSVEDTAGNFVEDTISALIDITAPSLALTKLPSLLSPTIEGTTDVDMAGQTINLDVTLNLGLIETTLSLQATVASDGTWSTGSIAGVGVGPVSVELYIADEAGNVSTVNGSSTITLLSTGEITTKTATSSDSNESFSNDSTELSTLQALNDGSDNIDI